ncbi:nucleoside 2-deoxyribosyltransferase [Variovorax sp. NFACC27]|uniref:nucleoside 2-deoxyribosyltransferase n=1 Tax=unclassified Variovorax TaxID=663243 RepID=UPI0008959CCA|nr:Nucleoside 2-deoxyribosyltransferase [Variovorax sp. NFACC28]SEG78372.1 Nucleoside 2-deoxyribosyltransferase [Variovorax sp. NFACC29]SFC95270.1 Nucleoside 2-deoxyribosyltransferase [Variovorax sp. NFACC26]SFG08538.1 Nucleoside 2-deoxyribosyltransferase [Variovorax sp. NFACC27]
MTTRPRIYLAGPDVFRPNAAEHFAVLTAVCDCLGLEALVPFDDQVTAATSPQAIYEANMQKLRAAQGVVANLEPFRGAEPDSGTVFEVGVAVMLGLPVVAYGVPPGDYVNRVGERAPLHRDAGGVLRDPDGMEVEDFGLRLNLMLSHSVTQAADAEDALKQLAELLKASA